VRRSDTDANTNGYFDADVYADLYTDVYANFDPNFHADFDPNFHADLYTDVYANVYTDSDTNPNGTRESDHADRNDLFTVRERHGRDPPQPELQRQRREGQKQRHPGCVLLLGVGDGASRQ
jgi:hypothetical protein